MPTLRRFSVASSGGNVVDNTCRVCWCNPGSGATRKTCRRRLEHRLGCFSGFLPRPGGMTMR